MSERLQLDRGVSDLETREPSAAARDNTPPPESADSETASGAVTACSTAKPPIYVRNLLDKYVFDSESLRRNFISRVRR